MPLLLQTRRHTFCLLFILLAAGCSPTARVKNAAAPAAQAVPPSGIWKVDDVPYAPWTLTLKSEGNTVTGTVSQSRNHGKGEMRFTSLTEPVSIYGGTIRA